MKNKRITLSNYHIIMHFRYTNPSGLCCKMGTSNVKFNVIVGRLLLQVFTCGKRRDREIYKVTENSKNR